jgi:outer membrane receptor protein involved in Fe transport
MQLSEAMRQTETSREENMERKWLIGSVSALALVSGFSPALAQSAASASQEPEVVVVTAQKRDQALADVPLAIQAFSAASIENAGATKVSDLVTLIPGASIVSNSTPGFETVQIRGISSGTTGDGLVGYYLDEVPFGIPNLQLTPPASLLDVQRVEVIRGPAGTLYGQGSMGGTIKIVTRKPDTDAFSGAIEGTYSNTDGGSNNGSVDFAVNIPIVRDRFAIRISGGTESLSGYAAVPEFNLTHGNGFEGRNLRIVARFTPIEKLAITGMAWRIENSQDFNNGLTPGFARPTIAGTGNTRGYTDVNSSIYSLTAEWETSFGNLTANSSYIDHELDFLTGLLTTLRNDSTFETTSATQEIRLTSKGESNFNWIVGAYRRDATIENDVYFDTSLAAFGLPNVRLPVIDIIGPLTTESWSVFAEGTLALMDDKLEITAGVRYFEDERAGNTANRTAPITRSVTSATDQSTSPRFNIKYSPTKDGIFYFNAAKGFRSGVLQTAAQAAASNSIGIPTSTQIAPDSLWTYEIGTRWEIAGRRLIVEGSVYSTDWSDIQLQFSSPAVISVANVGDARIQGVDLGVAWKTPVNGLTMRFAGNLNSAEFTKVVPALAAALPTTQVGKPLPSVPNSNWSLSFDYRRPLPGASDLNFHVFSGYSWRADQIDAASGLKSGEIEDLTLRVGIEGARWRLEAFAKNLTNEDDAAVLTSTGLQIPYPRRIGIKLGYDF